jgi:hypothetical protein
MGENIFCYVCNKQTPYKRWCEFLRYHLKREHLDVIYTEKEYFDKFYLKQNENVCKICGKPTRFKGLFERYSKYCSVKCGNSDEEVKAIQRQKRKEYFESLSLEDAEIRNNRLKDSWKTRDVNAIVDKIKTTKLERYGNEKFNNSEQISKSHQDKTIEEKNLRNEKFLETISSRSDEEKELIYNKFRKSISETYKNDKEKITNKRKQTLIERYGNPNYRNVEKIKETNKKNLPKRQKKLLEDKLEEIIQLTNKIKTSSNEEIENLEQLRHKLLKHINRIIDVKEIVSLDTLNIYLRKFNQTIDGAKIVNVDYKNHIMYGTCHKCNENFELTRQQLYIRKKKGEIICSKCNEIKSSTSSAEKTLLAFIEDNYDGEILTNKKIIKPYELDIYLPNLNLAFEFNGLYWHNELNKPKDYHYMKTKMCEYNNIHLIHVYEDVWNYKRDIVKSRILNLLKKSNVIYARKCEIKELKFQEVKEFLIHNHIQGYCVSKINFGLFYENELVSVMTFGKLRKNLGNKTVDDKYELLRFCNKLNFTVVGGADKLFKYFKCKYLPKEVISYADRSWTMNNGNSLYDKLGFKIDSETKPNYSYIVDGIRLNRYKFRKDVLVNEGFDKSKSEHDIMLDREIFRIYDSGNLKYIFK